MRKHPVTDDRDPDTTITEKEEARLRAWIAQKNVAEVADAVEISRPTLLSILARMPVQRATLHRVKQVLAEMEESARSAR